MPNNQVGFTPTTPRCFSCNRFAKKEDVLLLRNKKSGIKRWFHRSCAIEYPFNEYWEEVDPSLGETSYDEERKLAGLQKE